MKQKLTKLGGLVLVLLITSLLAVFAGSGLVAADGANPVRTLPDEVNPGDEFQVTVTFTSPAANFTAIGLADVAPAGWIVSVDKTWCTPDADVDNHPTPEEADYIWFGPYAAGAGFTAVYRVQVPAGATLGTYTFTDGTLEYYIGGAGPYVVGITGDNEVEVGIPVTITFDTDPEAMGSITFAAVTYNDGNTVNKSAATYAITANPGSGYYFDHWVATGSLSVASASSASTTCTVAGAGTLSMVQTTETPPVGGTAYPPNKVLMLLPWIAAGAAIIVATSLLVRRRRSAAR
jgi:hypothetical protein